jgi:hypothetical protein
MIRPTEQHIHFLERDAFRLGDQEVDEDCEADIAGHKEEERFPIIITNFSPDVSRRTGGKRKGLTIRN